MFGRIGPTELILILVMFVVLAGILGIFAVVRLGRRNQQPDASAQRHNPAAWQDRER